MDKLSAEEQNFAYDVMAHVVTAGGDIDIPEVLANFRLLGRGMPFGRACVRTGDHPALMTWPRDSGMALTVVPDGRISPEIWGGGVVATGQKAPREQEKAPAPRVVAGYTIFEHPTELVVALSTAQIVKKAMNLCYREDDLGEDEIDGPLLLMLKAGSAEPFIGKKGGNEHANGIRYEDWATKALQELLGDNPLTWAKVIADGGRVKTETVEHKEVTRSLCRALCRRVLRFYIVERLEVWLDVPGTAPGQASQGAVNVLLAAENFKWMVNREVAATQPTQPTGAGGGYHPGGYNAGRGAGGRGAPRGGGRGTS